MGYLLGFMMDEKLTGASRTSIREGTSVRADSPWP